MVRVRVRVRAERLDGLGRYVGVRCCWGNVRAIDHLDILQVHTS